MKPFLPLIYKSFNDKGAGEYNIINFLYKNKFESNVFDNINHGFLDNKMVQEFRNILKYENSLYDLRSDFFNKELN